MPNTDGRVEAPEFRHGSTRDFYYGTCSHPLTQIHELTRIKPPTGIRAREGANMTDRIECIGKAAILGNDPTNLTWSDSGSPVVSNQAAPPTSIHPFTMCQGCTGVTHARARRGVNWSPWKLPQGPYYLVYVCAPTPTCANTRTPHAHLPSTRAQILALNGAHIVTHTYSHTCSRTITRKPNRTRTYAHTHTHTHIHPHAHPFPPDLDNTNLIHFQRCVQTTVPTTAR